ncbi:MAG: rod shape-determining protein [Pseudomonadota bacterium]
MAGVYLSVWSFNFFNKIGACHLGKQLGLSFFTYIAIDLGSSSTKVYLPSKDLFIEEPSLIALEQKSEQVIAIGLEAQKLFGMAPHRITVVELQKPWDLSNVNFTIQFLQALLEKIFGKRNKRIHEALFSIPGSFSEFEQDIFLKHLKVLPIRNSFFVRAPIAGAIGAGFQLSHPEANMFIDLGGGKTEISIICLNNIISSHYQDLGGKDLSRGLQEYCESKFEFLIGFMEAEFIKTIHGSVAPSNEVSSIEVKGTQKSNRLPGKLKLTTAEIQEALLPIIMRILKGISTVSKKVHPEIAADIVTNGLTFWGGGAKLKGLGDLMRQEFNLKVFQPSEPHLCVIQGMKKILTR